MKAAMDRLGCSTDFHWAKLGQSKPRYSKVCGVLTVGAHRYGGQELVLTYLINQALRTNCLVVSGDSESYTGAPAWMMGIDMKSKDAVLMDERGIACAVNVGKRVAEAAKILKAGISALKKELPEYFYTWEEIE